jgi:mono/diheme cytochrome c family protein
MSRLLLSAAVGVVALAAASSSSSSTVAPAASDRAKIARGQFIVTLGGCHDCHTPKKMGPHGPEPDLTRALSGHPEGAALPPPPQANGPWIASTNVDLTAWSGPWGISYAFNLTPDENTGIGSWSEETFVRAIQTGRHMGVSRPILPPMPWQNFAQLSEDDLKALYAYLRTLAPIKNRVPLPTPPSEVARLGARRESSGAARGGRS